MNLKYVKLSKSHIKQAYELGTKYFGLKTEYSWDWSISKVHAYLRSSFGFGIVCLDGKRVVGFVLVEKEYSHQKPKVAWLNYIVTDREHRHKRIGVELLSEAEDTLKRMGKNEIIVDIYEKNNESLKFFRENNFREKEEWVTLSRKI